MSTASRPGITWRTSSYSGPNGDCMEVGWHKSSYSAESGNCAEVAAAPEVVLVRDSKDRDGPVLSFPSAPWRAFLAQVSARGDQRG